MADNIDIGPAGTEGSGHAGAQAEDAEPIEGLDAGKSEPADDDSKDPIARAEARAEENWSKYLRVAADLENLRKRSQRDVENARKYGIDRFATDLLAALDSMEMTLAVGAGVTVESLLEGVSATLKLFQNSLEKSGVEQIDPEGEPFDPQLHEAITMQPSKTVEPGSVIEVIQKGYQLNGRLLRPARVIVAREPD